MLSRVRYLKGGVLSRLAASSAVTARCGLSTVSLAAPAAQKSQRQTRPTKISSASVKPGDRRLFHIQPPVQKVVPFLLADIGEGITECELIQWFVKEGETVEQFSKICEVQSDKAAVEITSRYDGIIKKLYCKAGDVAYVGAPLVDIETNEFPDDASPAAAEPEMAARPSEAVLPAAVAAKEESKLGLSGQEDAYILATPAVRRIAREHKIDLVRISGTGPGGRVLKGDVLAFVSGTATSAAPTPARPAAAGKEAPKATASAPGSTYTPPAIVRGEDKTVPLGPIQKAMYKAMTKSLQIPHFGYSDEIILNSASSFRGSINRSLKNSPNSHKYPFKKISYMPIFMKAMSMALHEFPVLNAALVGEDAASAQLKYRSAHNISIAMDTPNGLIVPNVKNVEQKSIIDIAADLERLKEAGQRNALTPADLKDGTITLSNIGNIGGTVLHPVLVTNQVCIAAVGRVQRLPRYETVFDPVTGEKKEIIVPKEVLHVSFNADHRVVDGATMARFVQLWKRFLEEPAILTAEMR
ncbi:2-oxoacid dehydrogenases acyltransferase-domain-containing protein [Phlyctochytrium arcticum]|nr:2-oxoacid dehydrogenases acyltransferase-domain-containing protein [Phlyctochytrium arcticum]